MHYCKCSNIHFCLHSIAGVLQSMNWISVQPNATIGTSMSWAVHKLLKISLFQIGFHLSELC